MKDKALLQRMLIKGLIFILCVCALILAYLFVLNNRYSHAGGKYYFDKWKKELIIAEEKKDKPCDSLKVDENKMKKVYDALVNCGYTQDYNTFFNGFTKADNYEKRKQIYDILTSEGEQIGDSYEEFMRRMHKDYKPDQESKNKGKRPYASPVLDENKLRSLYDTLKKGGYNQDYDTFVKGFTNPGNYAKRKQLYDMMRSRGEQIGDSYEEFMRRMHKDYKPDQENKQIIEK